MIAIRAPAMWNLNDAIRKSGSTTVTGVLDAGFSPHSDLIYESNLTPDVPAVEHGTHVAGTIGATFGNGIGVDGVNPFAQLIVFGKSTTGDMLSGLGSLLDARPDLRVVNISLGYNWGSLGIDTRSGARGAAARFVADVEGTMVAARLSGLAALGRTLPVIVAAAANDSNDGFGDQDAVHATPFANAALAHGAAPIIVVEAVDLGSAGSLTRASFSNLGGHVSAPGVDIQSTALANGYAVLSGTSMAAPHVAGLVSYIYSLDPAFPAPTMTANPMRELLVRNGQAAFGGAAKVVDGFATALDLDRIRGDRRTLKLLLDVDDGTLDGNTRLNADGSVNSTDAKGDGTIDMSDFRRWRDWLLQAEAASNLDLDGADNHPKKDLNGDGVVSTPISKELIHPRGDFNGDGEISRGKTRMVPGVKNGQPATDLEVLQVLFQDPDYQAAELPDLIDSWDLEVDPARCLGLPGVTTVQTTVSESGQSGTIAARTHTAAARRRIITLPVTSGLHQVRVEAFNGSGTPIASRQQEFNPNAGADFPLDPVCASLDVSVVFPATVVPGTPNVLDVRAGDRDPLSGVITFSSGIDIDVVAAGGTVVPATGQTGSGGQFIASATLSTGNTLLTLAVTATRSDGVSTTKIVSATGTTPPPPPPPPPDNCPDVRIDDDADVAAASGLTCFLNARIGGFNNRLTVLVSLPQLTQVVEAFGVQFEVPGGLSLPALKTLGTGAVFAMAKLATLDLPALTESRSTTGNSGGIIVSNAADLTTIKFGALQRVDGGLAIETNPKLTDISGIACGVRVNGNLWIRNNPLLSTSAAQAKANCMIVTGTTTISGNQSP